MVTFKKIDKELVESILHGLLVVINAVHADTETQTYHLESISTTPLGVHFGATYKNLGEVSKGLFGFELSDTKAICQHNQYHSFFYEQKAVNNLFLSNLTTRTIHREDWLNKARKLVDYLHHELYYWNQREHHHQNSFKVIISEKRHGN